MSREGRTFLRPQEDYRAVRRDFPGVWHSLSMLDPLCTSRRFVLLILSSGRRQARAEALLFTASSRANYTTARNAVLRHNVL